MSVSDEVSSAGVDPSSEGESRVSRRELIRRAGIGGGVVLASGMLASPVLAQTNPVTPDPSRTGRDPLAAAELATKTYVDERVMRSGDTMLGALYFDGPQASDRAVGTDSDTDFTVVSNGSTRIRVTGGGATEFTGPVSLASSLTVAGDIVGQAGLSVDGNTVLASDLLVEGSATLDASLSVGGSSTFEADVLFEKESVFEADATFLEDLNVESDLSVLGEASFEGKVFLSRTASEEDDSEEDLLLAVNKEYVDDLFLNSRGGTGALGGLHDLESRDYDEVFFENDVVVRSDYTLGTRFDPRSGELVREGDDPEGPPVVLRKNAMTAGPVAIRPDVAVTIPEGSVWTIV